MKGNQALCKRLDQQCTGKDHSITQTSNSDMLLHEKKYISFSTILNQNTRNTRIRPIKMVPKIDILELLTMIVCGPNFAVS